MSTINHENQCGKCPKFTKINHSPADLEQLRKEEVTASKSLLANPNVNDSTLRTRLEHSFYTTDTSVTFGTVPSECNPVGGLVASNRICIKEGVRVVYYPL